MKTFHPTFDKLSSELTPQQLIDILSLEHLQNFTFLQKITFGLVVKLNSRLELKSAELEKFKFREGNASKWSENQQKWQYLP